MKNRRELISWVSPIFPPLMASKADLQSENVTMQSELAIFVHVRKISRAVLIAMSSQVKLEAIFPAETLCFEVVLSEYLRKTSDLPLLHSKSEEPLIKSIDSNRDRTRNIGLRSGHATSKPPEPKRVEQSEILTLNLTYKMIENPLASVETPYEDPSRTPTARSALMLFTSTTPGAAVAEWYRYRVVVGFGREFEPSITKDPPCRAAMHAKSVES
ncbi:hypothetical protein TNCV_2213841 [Trichonephila clavipes]|nr:hypothetical protein TNCV_2213841 [Trichonephila clavipes]